MTSIAVNTDFSDLLKNPSNQGVKRAPGTGGNEGTQERGSGTDSLTKLRRPTTVTGGGHGFQPARPILKGGPGTQAGSQSGQPVTDPNDLPRFITPENTLRRQRLGFDVRDVRSPLVGAEDIGFERVESPTFGPLQQVSARNVSADTGQLDSIIDQLRNQATSGEGAPAAESEFLRFLQRQVRGDLEGGLNREELIRRQFNAVLPEMEAQFQDQAEQVAGQTAALGRTGSGLVDRQFADLENEQERLLQGQLGQITSRAAAQAIQDRLGLMGAGQGLAETELSREAARAQALNNALSQAGGLAATGAELGLQGQMANQDASLRAGLANQQTALQRAQANQQARLQSRLANQDAGLQSAMANQEAALRAGLANQGSIMDAQRLNRNTDLERGRFLERQRAFEDRMARQAMNDRARQMQFLQQGFANQPFNQLNQGINTLLQGSGQFGANAALINQGLGGLAQAGASSGGLSGLINSLFGGPPSGSPAGQGISGGDFKIPFGLGGGGNGLPGGNQPVSVPEPTDLNALF